jgi:hypothetical protein
LHSRALAEAIRLVASHILGELKVLSYDPFDNPFTSTYYLLFILFTDTLSSEIKPVHHTFDDQRGSALLVPQELIFADMSYEMAFYTS